ncbi:MAG: RES family NAD+ phosphorylase [Actinomycetota bacterium]|nr:RES family NAD+ phosphorylase [Actinomycetota bacterium]
MSPLGLPPEDLTRFPAFDVDRRRSLYRIHRTDVGPWWFSGDGTGRFDLRDGRGSCYLAVTPVGAFIEVFRVGSVIPEAEVDARSLSSLVPPARVRLADCTVSAARKFGITGAIHTQPDYTVPHVWAEAFAASGFGGIRYRLSHDPAQRELGIVLFGTAGEQSLPVRRTEPVPASLIEAARQRFGLVVAPTPG